MSLTKRWSEADCLSRIMLSHAPRQATVSLTFDVRQKKTMNTLKYVVMILATVALAHAAARPIETQLSIIKGGTTFSAPRVTSHSGTPFEMTIGAPVDDDSATMPVGATLRGVVSAEDEEVKFDLTFVSREPDGQSKKGYVQVHAFVAKEYLIKGKVELNQESRVQLPGGQTIVLKFAAKELKGK